MMGGMFHGQVGLGGGVERITALNLFKPEADIASFLQKTKVLLSPINQDMRFI